ncbi:MAG: MazG-like family protein [Clostridium sp.]|uniref:MazG-like family protein n=1 Tax=Clostridium sp. TaxID=1506 RepID=UPI00304AA48D
MRREEFNIMSNIKVIEGLKAELVCIIGDFFKLLSRGSNVAQDAILDCVSGAIIILYILAEKLGYSHLAIDETMKKKLKVGIVEGDSLEKNGKELSKLHDHLRERS